MLKKVKINPIIWVSALALATGFIVTLGTALLLDNKSVHTLPGGSLSGGLFTGFIAQEGPIPIVFGAIFGILGWAVYIALF